MRLSRKFLLLLNLFERSQKKVTKEGELKSWQRLGVDVSSHVFRGTVLNGEAPLSYEVSDVEVTYVNVAGPAALTVVES